MSCHNLLDGIKLPRSKQYKWKFGAACISIMYIAQCAVQIRGRGGRAGGSFCTGSAILLFVFIANPHAQVDKQNETYSGINVRHRRIASADEQNLLFSMECQNTIQLDLDCKHKDSHCMSLSRAADMNLVESSSRPSLWPAPF